MTSYERAGGGITWGGKAIGADAATFEEVGPDFGRDATRAYFGATPIAGADAATFRHLRGRWAADAATLYFRDSRVVGADRATFEVLDDSWARDARWAFRLGRMIPGAIAASFRACNPLYATDGTRAWTLSGELRDIDAAAFRVLDPGRDPLLGLGYGHATDGRTLWYYAEGMGQARAIAGAEAGSARVIAHAWCTDGRQVWHEGHPLKDVGVASFEPMGMWWARDARRVYYGHTEVKGAEAASFEVEQAGAIRGRDAAGCYVRGSSASEAEWAAAEVRVRP